jgi:tRNA(Ile)-lysidine synthase TilS/MesJ
MTRERDDTRHEYETYTKNVRFEQYEKQKCPILLGHNYEDTIENILANIASKKKYENLKGMQPLTIQRNVTIMRPLLSVSKSDIYAYAEVYGIPYLPDSTPEWSRRGKLRDHVIPALQQYEPQLLLGLVALSEYVADACKYHQCLSYDPNKRFKS